MRTIKALTLVPLLCLLGMLPTTALSQADQSLPEHTWSEQMDAIFKPALQAETYAGAAVVVVVDRKVAFIKAYGVADAAGRPFTVSTRSYLGSVSKSFVGLVVVQLAAEGKLNLDAPVQGYLPEFKLASDASDITIRHLLTHTSGLSTYTGNRNQSDEDQSADGLQRTVAELADWPLDYQPGTHYEYSNANYQILGHLIEVVTGQPFAQALQARVFAPLNMKSSRVMHDFDHPNSADGFRFWGPVLVAHQDPMGTGLMPQGGVSTTAEDMGNYLIALMGGTDEIPNVWHPQLAHGHGLPDQGHYGAGWSYRGEGEALMLMHDGLNGGFTATAALKPHAGVGVAVVINTGGGFVAGDVDFVHKQVLHTVFPELPAAVETDFGPRWLQLVGILAGLAGLLAWVFSGARQGISGNHFALGLIVPTGLLLGLAYGVGVWLPRMFSIPLDGMAVFNPDIAWLLTATAGLALVWAMVRVVVLLITRGSH